MADDFDASDSSEFAADGEAFAEVLGDLRQRTALLVGLANSFAFAMTRAFAQAAGSGRRFDDVLKSLMLRLSNMALNQALRAFTSGLFGGGNLGGSSGGLFGGLFGGGEGEGVVEPFTIQPFAAGGVIGASTYFPLTSGLGLAGEAGPEAILPLQRGPDGRLGVAAAATRRPTSPCRS